MRVESKEEDLETMETVPSDGLWREMFGSFDGVAEESWVLVADFIMEVASFVARERSTRSTVTLQFRIMSQ